MSVEHAACGEWPLYDGGAAPALGFAVDIGTTTLALQLHDLSEGKLLATQGAHSRQAAFGADVLSRIAYADAHTPGEVSRVLLHQIKEMMRGMLAGAGRAAQEVVRVVMTGNTTMLHFAAGLDPHGIGRSPFVPASLFGQAYPDILPFLPARAEVYLPRCAGAYLGADLVCGMLAGRLGQDRKIRLLVDVGTNGEMALAVNGRLYGCATAAGPAFEGAQISMGMPAVAGAVSKVFAQNGGVLYRTIGDAPAQGICGTGLISAARLMLETGALDETGRMEADSWPVGGSGVRLTARDIRELQLAKAAIAAGIDTLLHAAGVSARAVDSLILAGGFGSVLDPDDAMRIGMIPADLAPKARAGGNLALSGAVHLLYAASSRAAAAELARKIEEIPLSTSPFFAEKYMQHMLFPEAGL